jgi:hypothetical protein
MLAPSGWPTIFAPMLTRPKATPTQQAALALGVVLAAGLGAGAGVGLVFAMALADRGGGAFPFPLAGLLVGTSSGLSGAAPVAWWRQDARLHGWGALLGGVLGLAVAALLTMAR